jgi:hypothetical protein
MSEQEGLDDAKAYLAKLMMVASMNRLRSAVNSIVGIYEERAARKQYDLLGDGSI